ncbi:MAG: virulence factor TspB C-terminal domain-related protein [Hylemonella sp.]
MNHVRRQLTCLLRWALLLVLGLVQVAHAQGTATVDQYCFNSNAGSCAGTWQSSPAAACAEGAAYWYNQNKAVNPQITACSINACSGRLDSPPNQFSCTLQPNNAYTYNNGLSYRSAAGSLPCPAAGTKATRNFTYAWDNSANGGGDVVQLTAALALAGSTSCVVADGSSCAATLGGFPTQAWSSLKPTSTGLYRHSMDYVVTYTGSNCTPSSTEKKLSDATDPVPPCPGAFGTVNGTPTCVPTGSRTPRDKPTQSDGTDAPVNAGNPSAGSRGSDSLANRSPGTGTNNGNNGSTPATSDGVGLRWGGGVPSTAGTSAGSTSTLKAEDIKTDCDKKPNSIGCSEYGTPDGSVTLGRTDSGFSSIAVVSFGAAASCPAPLPFDVAGRTYSVSFQSICTNANDYIRPVVLVLGAALAAFIFVAGFRS